MVRLDCECLYCGHRYRDIAISKEYDASCPKCEDSNIKVKPQRDSDGDAFGYRFDPKPPPIDDGYE